MKMERNEADKFVVGVISKFGAVLQKTNRIHTDEAEFTYLLPSGTQLVLHAKLCFDAEHIEINWRWILAD